MVGRGPRAQTPVVTRTPPGKQGVESALSLVAPILLSHPSCPALTCPARAVFHTLLPLGCLVGLGLASPLLCGGTARLTFAAAAGRSGRSHPRPRGSDNLGCPLRRLCAPLAPALTQPVARRHSHARGRPGLSSGAHACTRPQAPSQPQASDTRAARGIKRPNPQPRRQHTLLPHPLFFTVTRSPSVYSLAYRDAFILMQSPTLCGSPSPRLTTLAPHPTFPTIKLHNLPHTRGSQRQVPRSLPMHPTFLVHTLAPWRALSRTHCRTAH